MLHSSPVLEESAINTESSIQWGNTKRKRKGVYTVDAGHRFTL